MREYDLVIIGGGAAGILSSIEAKKKGINNIIVIEKDPVIGGMLSSIDYPINKDKTVTGKEYKEALLKELQDYDVEVQLNTMVLKIEDKEVVCTSATNGIEKIKGKNIIIANGGREGGRKAIDMVGDRCSGIYNVSMTKKIFAMNMIPGKKVFIYGNATLYMIEEYLKNSNIEVVGIVTTNGKETYGLTDNIYEGYTIPPNYDSMIAKIIAYGSNRNEAISKMKRALEELVIDGIDTNRDFLFEIIKNPNFIRGNFDTSFIEKEILKK